VINKMASADIMNAVMPVLGTVTWIFLGLCVLGMLAVIGWIVKNELMHKTPVLVYDKGIRGGGFYTTRGGIYVNRLKKNKLFYLRNNKKFGLSPDKPMYIHFNGKTGVFMVKNNEGTYSWGSIEELKNVPKAEGISIGAGEEDINTAINCYDLHYKSFNNKIDMMQLALYGTMAVGFICLALVFIYFFQKLDVLLAFGKSLEVAAQHLGTQTVSAGVVGG